MHVVYFLIQMKRAMTTVSSRIMALTTRSGLERRMADISMPHFCLSCHQEIPVLPALLRKNLVGCVFGRLTVQHFAQTRKKKSSWCCACTCGGASTVVTYSLISGETTSCGCWRHEVLHERLPQHNRRHGQAGTSLYVRWVSMIGRCTNPTNPAYENYGGRGITVCNRWRHSFEAFAADMGMFPPGTSLERRDNNGPYSPDNCYWAPRLTQANNKRNNRLITWESATHTLAEWARLTGLSTNLIGDRLRRGWDIARALSTPLEVRYSHPVQRRRNTP